MSDIAAQTLDAALDKPRAGSRPAKLSGPSARRRRARTAMLEGPIVSTLVKLALPTIGVMVAGPRSVSPRPTTWASSAPTRWPASR